MSKSKSKLGALLLFLAAFIWGVAFIFQKRAMDYIGPFTFLAVRCALAAIFLGLVLIFLRKGVKNAFSISKETLLAGIICGLVFFVASASQQIGMVSTDAGKAGFITAMYIVLVPIWGIIFFKKKPAARIVLGVVIASIGLYLLCVSKESAQMGEFFKVSTGDIFVFICAISFSWHIMVCDKYANLPDPVQISFIQMLTAALIDSVLCFIFEAPTLPAIMMASGDLLYAGVMSGGIAFTIQLVGQKYTEPTAASLMMSFESVFAVLAGWLVLGEKLSGRELLGCVIMFVAIILVQTKGNKNG